MKMDKTINNDNPSHKSYPTLMQIKAIIPSHLFESNVWVSLYFVVKDFLLIFLLYVCMQQCERLLPTEFLWIAFPVYWYLQGTMLMALFVLGHDCGHGSFSKYAYVNDVIGTVLHAIVLTPYYPWKISHRNHHKNTGNIDKDEVFYPIRKKNDNGNKFFYLFGLGIGWFVYLWRGYHPRQICHFNPLEAMFGDHVTGCTLSISAIVGWVICLYHYACSTGLMGLVKYYVIPELVFGSWLLIVTFLHHIEEDTPWYSAYYVKESDAYQKTTTLSNKDWNYVKGQLSSVDRSYGWAHDVIHNIGTHQIHHLFSRIPHYNLEESTRHFRKYFPELSRARPDPILPSLLRMFRKFSEQCQIDNSVETHVYK